MPGDRIDAYRLSPQARADLTDIWSYTAEVWSPDQADRYLQEIFRALEMLVEHPEIVREQVDLNPPVRIYRHRSHLIAYLIEGDCLVVVRVLHVRRNWQDMLN